MALKYLISIIFLAYCLDSVNSHGRLMDPPGRASLWRFPEFHEFHPPVNYNDNELFCGGKDVQHLENGGRCGECGDNWAHPKPRANENGGMFGNGVIARNYTQGQNITVVVDLTAPHLGHFEFKICKLSGPSDIEEQICFDKVRLPILLEDGKAFDVKYPIDNSVGVIRTIVTLPANLTCDRCTFLWYYETGNSWGECEDGSGAIGCGPQEEFRGCSDISIHPSHE